MKQKDDINGKLEEKWLERFEEKQSVIKKLQSMFARTDAQIDALVYELYNLDELGSF